MEKGFWGSGWSFPPEFSKSDNKLSITHGEQNIKQSIDLILGTTAGERSMLSEWGSTLNQYVLKSRDATLKGQMIDSIKNCLLEYEPRITVEGVRIIDSDIKSEGFSVEVDYRIKTTNSRQNHVYPYSDIEGTNLNRVGAKA